MRCGVVAIAVLCVANTCTPDEPRVDERIAVTPKNAEAHRIHVTYAIPADLVRIEMPNVFGGQEFDQATLLFNDKVRFLKIPIHSERKDKTLVIAFWADAQTVEQCVVLLRFQTNKGARGIVITIPIKDFVVKERK